MNTRGSLQFAILILVLITYKAFADISCPECKKQYQPDSDGDAYCEVCDIFFNKDGIIDDGDPDNGYYDEEDVDALAEPSPLPTLPSEITEFPETVAEKTSTRDDSATHTPPLHQHPPITMPTLECAIDPDKKSCRSENSPFSPSVQHDIAASMHQLHLESGAVALPSEEYDQNPEREFFNEAVNLIDTFYQTAALGYVHSRANMEELNSIIKILHYRCLDPEGGKTRARVQDVLHELNYGKKVIQLGIQPKDTKNIGLRNVIFYKNPCKHNFVKIRYRPRYIVEGKPLTEKKEFSERGIRADINHEIANAYRECATVRYFVYDETFGIRD